MSPWKVAHGGKRLIKPLVRLRMYSAGAGANNECTTVTPSEGNEVRRDGRQGVGAPHSTVEVGERGDHVDPEEGRGCRKGGIVDGNHDADIGP